MGTFIAFSSWNASELRERKAPMTLAAVFSLGEPLRRTMQEPVCPLTHLLRSAPSGTGIGIMGTSMPFSRYVPFSQVPVFASNRYMPDTQLFQPSPPSDMGSI